MPDGQKWVEGVRPKQLPAPAPAVSHALPSDEPIALDQKEIKDLED
jgi:hypothetical protein